MSGEMTERERILRWIETWKEIGPILEREKYERYAQPDELGRFLNAVDGLIVPFDVSHSRWTSSGLIEQQRLFQKLTK